MYKTVIILNSIFFILTNISGQDKSSIGTEVNKESARNFYNDLWFENNTDKYSEYVANKYIVHDIGDRKGVTENAVEQKKIADFFWDNGDLNSQIDFQIAEGDLVATRWIADYEPKTLMGKLFIGTNPIPIINVLRFEDGKIVEIWNHRHDIDTNQTMKFVLKGLLFGLLIAMVPTYFVFRLKRKLQRIKK